MKSKRTVFRVSGVAILLILLLALVTPVLAFEPMSGDRVVIEEGEVIEDDLYVSANTFILNGTIKGDLLAVGSAVIIGPSGVVEEDLMAAGQAVVINGTVGDDARIAGSVLSMGNSAEVGGDLVAFGYSFEAEPGSTIGRDALVFGSQAVLSGDVERNVIAGSGGLQINGSVGGDVTAEVGGPGDVPPISPMTFMPLPPGVPAPTSISGGLTLGPDATIEGDLNYTADTPADLPSGAVSGDVSREEPVQPEEEAPPTASERVLSWFFKFLRQLVTLLVIGLLLAWLLPDLVRNSAQTLQTKPLPSLLWGFLTHILFFVLIFVLIIVIIFLTILLGTLTLGSLVMTVVGAGAVVISSLLLGFQLAYAYVAKIVVAVLIGRLILGLIHKDSAENRFWPMLLGVALLVLLIAILQIIPILGGLLIYLITIFGLGALVLVGRDLLRKKPEAVVEDLSAQPELFSEEFQSPQVESGFDSVDEEPGPEV